MDTSTWVLTRQGASRVKATFHVEMGSPILQIRDFPLKELTTFEKFMKLADAGWQWKPQPGPALCLQLEPARLDDNGLFENKTFYTGKDVLDLYLECLLSSDQLMEVGITFVPHKQKQSVYSALLDGKPFTPPKPKPPMVADDHALQKAPRLAISDVEPGDVEPGDVEPGDSDNDDVDMPHEQMTLEEYLNFYLPTPAGTPQAPIPRDGVPLTPQDGVPPTPQDVEPPLTRTKLT